MDYREILVDVYHKIHGNFQVPYPVCSHKIHGNFPVPFVVCNHKVHGHFHVRFVMFGHKVHGNFLVLLLYANAQGTWKFPCTLFLMCSHRVHGNFHVPFLTCGASRKFPCTMIVCMHKEHGYFLVPFLIRCMEISMFLYCVYAQGTLKFPYTFESLRIIGKISRSDRYLYQLLPNLAKMSTFLVFRYHKKI